MKLRFCLAAVLPLFVCMLLGISSACSKFDTEKISPTACKMYFKVNKENKQDISISASANSSNPSVKFAYNLERDVFFFCFDIEGYEATKWYGETTYTIEFLEKGKGIGKLDIDVKGVKSGEGKNLVYLPLIQKIQKLFGIKALNKGVPNDWNLEKRIQTPASIDITF